jgi:L-lactate dehydrogenase complex protein LldG
VSARERVLSRVRDAVARREARNHPGPFEGWRPDKPASAPVDAFAALFAGGGGEIVRVAASAEAKRWLADLAATHGTVAIGETVPAHLRPDVDVGDPESAPLGVSMAVGAVAETGSLILDARDGRRTQLLPPTHAVLVHAANVHATLAGALTALRDDLPSAVGLHSGPSKSADIGQILVKGVHGPGRVIALVMEE